MPWKRPSQRTNLVKTVNDIFNNRKIRKIIRRTRLPLGVAVTAVIFCLINKDWFFAGLAISLFGAAWQWWCFGSIKTSKVLARKGPYTFVRNPMYLARFFLVLGAFVMTGSIWAVCILIPVYYLYMVNRVKREEVKLQGIFGESYETFLKEVNRFLPNFKNVIFRDMMFFKLEYFNRNNGFPNMLAVFIVYALAFWVAFYIKK